MACHGVSRHEVPRGTGADEQGAAVADQNGQEKQAGSHVKLRHERGRGGGNATGDAQGGAPGAPLSTVLSFLIWVQGLLRGQVALGRLRQEP